MEAGRMKAAGTTHPTSLPCPRGLPSPWGSLWSEPGCSSSSCNAGEQGWGLLAGRNHHFTFPSQLEAPTPKPRVLRANSSLGTSPFSLLPPLPSPRAESFREK